MTIHELLALTGLTESDEIPVWDAEASSEPTKKITAQNFASSIKTLASLLGTVDVVNNLTSTATTAPLAAAQGKALDEKMSVTNVYSSLSNVNSHVTGYAVHRTGNVLTISLQLDCSSSNPLADNTAICDLGSLQPGKYAMAALFKMSDGKAITGSLWAERITGKITYYGDNITSNVAGQMTYVIVP